jgi:hypothetical protein
MRRKQIRDVTMSSKGVAMHETRLILPIGTGYSTCSGCQVGRVQSHRRDGFQLRSVYVYRGAGARQDLTQPNHTSRVVFNDKLCTLFYCERQKVLETLRHVLRQSETAEAWGGNMGSVPVVETCLLITMGLKR